MPERRDTNSQEMAMLIGQLVAATEAAGKGIEALSREARDNATALAAAARSLEIVEQTVSSLNNLVKDGGDDDKSILGQLRTLKNTNETLRITIERLSKEMEEVRGSVGDFRTKENKLQGGWAVVVALLAAIGWLFGISLAVYEAIKK